MISPGKTIGILGGGQLGRMLAQAAQTLGYRVRVYEPEAGGPAGAVANREVNAPYTDLDALQSFARGCDVLTYEFENIPVEPLQAIEKHGKLCPASAVLEVCQNRWREKAWLRRHHFPHASFAEVEPEDDLAAATRRVGWPCVVKTADFGYDGKGQVRVCDTASLARAEAAFAGRRAVVERWVDFKCELSVICARTEAGATRVFPLSENLHTRHILDISIAPARVSPAIAREAESLAVAIAEKLGVVGLLAVELFLTDRGDLLVNELAPRPHNSGHWSLDGCFTSQFEQHVRAICGLPLGEVTLRAPTVMVNLLGDHWHWQGDQVVAPPRWEAILAAPRAKLHLYGKTEPRRGRKMGHFTVSAAEVETAWDEAQALKAQL